MTKSLRISPAVIRDPYPHVGIPNSEPVTWVCRPKGCMHPTVRVQAVRWHDARLDGARQLKEQFSIDLEPGQVECVEESSPEAVAPPDAVASRTPGGATASGDELYALDTGTISVVAKGETDK